MRFISTRDTLGVVITNVTLVNGIAAALRTRSSYTGTLHDATWRVGQCGAGPELSPGGPLCSCASRTSLKPCDVYGNWGGFNGTTCSAPSQTLTLSFE